MSAAGEDDWTASRALGRAVVAARESVGLTQTAFGDATGFPLSTLRSIEKARRPSRWTSTLDALDQAMAAAGVTDWPGWRAVQGRPGVADVVTMTMVDQRIREAEERRSVAEQADLADLSARLNPADLALVAALARWLALRTG